MSDKNTAWQEATTNPYKALAGLLSCLDAGHNAWIEIQNNGNQRFPIRKKNPKLDNPFNWTMNYGCDKSALPLPSTTYDFNETQKELTFLYDEVFGTPEAVQLYQKFGTVTPGLFKGSAEESIRCPVKKQDILTFKNAHGEYYDKEYWLTIWKPKENIPYYITDTSIGDVFVVCYNEEPADKVKSLKTAAAALNAYADILEQTP